MSAYLLPQPQQFFDNNGDPLSGGKVYTCVPGASGYTRAYQKDTYTDATGLTTNPNPVILDSFGRCNIWGDGANYKLFIFNSSDVLIDAIDNLAPILGSGTDSRIGSTGTASCRNKIRNPRFMVNQRNVSGTVSLASGSFGHDGWKGGASGCTYTLSTTQGRTTLNITAGSLVQTVDGVDLAAGANTHTLSWGGTCQGKIGAGDYGASGVTGSATGGTNINVEFGTGTLYEPQFEIGSTPSPFSCLDYGAELERCSEYLFSTYPPGVVPGTANQVSSSVKRSLDAAQNYASLYIPFKRMMPGAPTSITLYNPSTGAVGSITADAASVTAGVSAAGVHGVNVSVNNISIGATVYIAAHILASREL